MFKNYFCPFLFLVTFTANQVGAFDFDYRIGGRVRHEEQENKDLNKTIPDYRSFTGSRFWLEARLRKGEKVFYLQPQFSHIWGQEEGGTAVSGGSLNPKLFIHQAYMSAPIVEGSRTHLMLGRFELSYGDELILGALFWSHVGRSFDAAKVYWEIAENRLDVFSSRLVDRTVTSGLGDKVLNGMYWSGRLDPSIFSEIDVYLLNLNDSTQLDRVDVYALGLRSKGTGELLSQRVEATYEDVDQQNEFQIDAEVGLKMQDFGRLTLNGFMASKGFNQLFPTAHKWLGITDVVSRRNIQGYQLRLETPTSTRSQLELAYFVFERTDRSAPFYDYSGIEIGLNSSNRSKSIGTEWDLIWSFKESKELSYQLGLASFNPGAFLENNERNRIINFAYLQALMMF